MIESPYQGNEVRGYRSGTVPIMGHFTGELRGCGSAPVVIVMSYVCCLTFIVVCFLTISIVCCITVRVMCCLTIRVMCCVSVIVLCCCSVRVICYVRVIC